VWSRLVANVAVAVVVAAASLVDRAVVAVDDFDTPPVEIVAAGVAAAAVVDVDDVAVGVDAVAVALTELSCFESALFLPVRAAVE